MENRSEFNLIQNLNHWKKELSKSGALTNDNILELESHLLDEIEKLQTLELSEEECFFIAKKRMGQLDTLKSEYQKVNVFQSFAHKVEPYLKGVLIYLSFLSISKTLLFLTSLLAIGLNLGNSIQAGLLGFIGILILVPLVILKSKKANRSIRRLNKLSTLLIITLICKPLEYFIQIFSPKSLGILVFSSLSYDFHIYQLILLALLLIGSLVLLRHQKRANKLTLQS